MAGMPREVLTSAERTLSALEKNHVPENGEAIQLSLFQLDDPTLASVRNTLRKADLDNMTPLQAFDLLRKLKEEVGADKS
jgi:DNA mismatch repair protein MutS